MKTMQSFIPHTGPCDCYECVGSKYEWVDGRKRLVNNLKKHTQLEPCEKCGKLKTEYRDLGTKGYYECWWCNERAGEHFEGMYIRGLEE